jgi:hypothetical protein
VFQEISLLANKVGEQYNVGKFDLLDGSIGKRWSQYRKGKDWALPPTKFPLSFEDKRDFAFAEAMAYKLEELSYFRKWVEDVYRIKYLPQYLQGKYGGIIKA